MVSSTCRDLLAVVASGHSYRYGYTVCPYQFSASWRQCPPSQDPPVMDPPTQDPPVGDPSAQDPPVGGPPVADPHVHVVEDLDDIDVVMAGRVVWRLL
ncbi:hypothetical protein V6N13_093387 [Hibiscus sabdariffa]